MTSGCARINNPGYVVAGAVASVIVHELGHIAMAEIEGVDYQITNPGQIDYYGLNDREERSIGRAGFITQLAGGFLLNRFCDNKDFNIGYNFLSLGEVITYSARGGGDFDMIDHGADSDIDRAVYLAMSGWNSYDAIK